MYTVSKKTEPLRLIWHNFINSQRLVNEVYLHQKLIINKINRINRINMVEIDHIQFSVDTVKVFELA